MKHVGEAMKHYTLSSAMQTQIVAIGVATWGIIHNRDSLVQEEVRPPRPHAPLGQMSNLCPLDPQGCFPAHYVMDDEGQGLFSCLDNNHTHFLLVDDGTQGHYGVEIELRTHLERLISRKSLSHKG